MADIENIIGSIDIKVRELVADRISLQKKLEESKKEIESLQSQIMELVEENRNLKKEKQLNNLTNIITNNSDVSESKILINDLLKKINRSISIISKDND